MEGLSKINYKGKEIIRIDYSSFSDDKANQKQKTLQLLAAANEEYAKHPKNSVLAMGVYNNFSFDMDVLSALKKGQNEFGSYTKKSAIVGVKGLLKAGYNFVIGLTNNNNNAKAFESEQEAKDWLVSD